MKDYTIAVLYDEKKEKEALETFEGVQSELSNFKIEYDIKKGKKKQIVLDGCAIIFMPFQENFKPNYDNIYTAEKYQKNYGQALKEKAKHVYYHKTTFQHLVDIVVDAKEHMKK